MPRTRIKLAVYVDLDPMPGTFHSAESAQAAVRGLLHQNISHYNPMVSIESWDTSKQHGEETVTDWGPNIREIRTEDPEGNVDKKMVDTTEHPTGETFTPGKF